MERTINVYLTRTNKTTSKENIHIQHATNKNTPDGYSLQQTDRVTNSTGNKLIITYSGDDKTV